MREFTIKKVKAIILSVVIAIVLASFVIYIVEVFEPRPDYGDYCGEFRGPKIARNIEEPVEIIDQTACEEVEGAKWMNGYCDYNYECQQEYDTARDQHRFVVFLVAVPAGLVAVAVGIGLALPSVSSGLMLGGVFLTFFGTTNYWSNISNWLRVLILGIVLAILIWLGYKKLEN